MALADIPVLGLDGGLTGNGRALLIEVAEGLACFAAGGEARVIDLSGLPLTEADRDWLRRELGEGEVSVRLAAGGESIIHETAYSGVWWVEHRNEHGRRMSEFIEITRLPELLLAHPDDVILGSERLNNRILELD